jgi:hypothetical protein
MRKKAKALHESGTEAAWLNGNNLEKEAINTKKEKEEKQLKALTLTGLLMEGVSQTCKRFLTQCRHLLQLRVFALGLLQDKNIRIGAFPQCQKIFALRQRPHPRRIRTFLRLRLQRIRPRHSQLRQRSFQSGVDTPCFLTDSSPVGG